MLHNKYVEDYIKKWKCGKLTLNKKRIQLIGLIEKEILPHDDLYYFDEEQINNYIEFSEEFTADFEKKDLKHQILYKIKGGKDDYDTIEIISNGESTSFESVITH